MKQETLYVFYDGACHLCSREIDHYKTQEVEDTVSWVDISSDDFREEAFGYTKTELEAQLHSQLNGKSFIGVDTFIEIWKRIPKYRWAATAIRSRFVYPFAKSAYWIFAKIRPHLPKRKCEAGTCHV